MVSSCYCLHWEGLASLFLFEAGLTAFPGCTKAVLRGQQKREAIMSRVARIQAVWNIISKSLVNFITGF